MPAPTTPASWLFAPDCSATAVRDPLVEMAKPWKKPAATLAAPMPIISWLGSTSSPRRAAKLDAVAMVSVRETSVIPAAASSSGPTSLKSVQGSSGRGRPLGSDPTVLTPWLARSKIADDHGRTHHRHEHGRDTSGQSGQAEEHDDHEDADDERRQRPSRRAPGRTCARRR